MKIRRRVLLRSFAVSLLLMSLLVWACRKSNETSPDLTTTESALDTATSPTTSSTGTASSQFYVEFKGTESFIFPTDTAVPRRLVVIKEGNGHIHKPVIVLPRDTVTATTNIESDLKNIFGAATVNCMNFGACVVTPKAGVAMRIVDADGNPPTTSFTKTTRFINLVPSLKKISKDFGSGEISDADPALTNTAADPYPKGDTSTTDPFVAYVEINGGELDALAACGRVAYIPTDTSRTDRTVVEMANRVLWTGKTAKPAKLQINRDDGTGHPTGWKDVNFKDSRFVHILVLNEPVTTGGSDHFELHAKVGKNKTIKLPKFNHDQDCEALNQSNVIGCSASQWP